MTARFILYDYTNGGYAIYDKETNNFLERSKQPNSSPFYNQSGKYYYLGLNQYAVYNNHEYIDVYTNETIDVLKFPALNFVSKKQINTMLTNSSKL